MLCSATDVDPSSAPATVFYKEAFGLYSTLNYHQRPIARIPNTPSPPKSSSIIEKYQAERMNWTRWLFSLLSFKTVVSNTTRKLYATNYGGTVTHLSLEEHQGIYSFHPLAETYDCGDNPAWMELDKSRSVLLCLNEAYVSLNCPLDSTSPSHRHWSYSYIRCYRRLDP